MYLKRKPENSNEETTKFRKCQTFGLVRAFYCIFSATQRETKGGKAKF
jgi:hypothetical protein